MQFFYLHGLGRGRGGGLLSLALYHHKGSSRCQHSILWYLWSYNLKTASCSYFLKIYFHYLYLISSDLQFRCSKTKLELTCFKYKILRALMRFANISVTGLVAYVNRRNHDNNLPHFLWLSWENVDLRLNKHSKSEMKEDRCIFSVLKNTHAIWNFIFLIATQQFPLSQPPLNCVFHIIGVTTLSNNVQIWTSFTSQQFPLSQPPLNCVFHIIGVTTLSNNVQIWTSFTSDSYLKHTGY